MKINIPPIPYAISMSRSILSQCLMQFQYQNKYIYLYWLRSLYKYQHSAHVLINMKIKLNIPLTGYSISRSMTRYLDFFSVLSPKNEFPAK